MLRVIRSKTIFDGSNKGEKANSFPPSLPATNVQLTTIAYAASDHLDIPYLASIYDRGVAVEPSQGKSLHPVNANRRLTMTAEGMCVKFSVAASTCKPRRKVPQPSY